MEKRNTRVAVPLSEEGYDAVSFLAKLQGVSRGRFLADVLDVAIPGFVAVQAAYKAAMAVEGEERAQLIAGMAEAERRLMESLRETMPGVEFDVYRPADARAPEKGKRAPAGRTGRADPPNTNRGVQNLPDEDRGH